MILNAWSRLRTQRAAVFAFLVLGTLAVADDGNMLPLSMLLQPLTDLTVTVTAIALRACGFTVAQTGNEIYLLRGFGYAIDYRCTGIWPIVILAALISADRKIRRVRLPALLVGTSLLSVLNLLRLITLFAAGVKSPELFSLLHDLLWPAITIVAIVWLWRRLRKIGPHQVFPFSGQNGGSTPLLEELSDVTREWI